MTFAQAKQNPSIIYVGTYYGSVYMTSDGGAHWTDITPSGADYNASVTGIAIDFGSPNAITVTYGGFSYHRLERSRILQPSHQHQRKQQPLGECDW